MTQPDRDQPSNPAGSSRRDFLKTGSAALAAGVVAGAGTGPASRAQAAPEAPKPAPGEPEWRNRQSGMAYRRLGRTNLMVSEVVCGGDPITLDNYKHLELALDMGLNYLDMAPAYNNGDTERAYGKLLAESSGRRDKVFLTTKVSDFTQVRNDLYQHMLEGLPGDRQAAIRKRADELKAERGVEAPGYFLEYFPGERKSFEPFFIRLAMMEEYGAKVEGSPKLRETIISSVEGSLRRVGVDHFDILMCPHGANTPEDLTPELAEVFADLKKQGKVRFLGVTSHNDPAGVLRRAADVGHYDVAMVAYNVINGGFLDGAIRHAASKDMGLIAMKAAHAVATHHKSLQPVPAWRVAKVQQIVPGPEHPALKAYLWALQNPRISAVISNLWDENYVKENLAVAGRKVEFHSA